MLPTFSRNEKIFLASFAGVLAILAIAISGFVWIKAKELTTFEVNSTVDRDYLLPTPFQSIISPTTYPLAIFTDPEYNFSFSYPSFFAIREVIDPADTMLAYAQENYEPYPFITGVSPYPTPAPQNFSSIVRQYSLSDSSNNQIDFISATVIRGDYLSVSQGYQEMVASLDHAEGLERKNKPQFSEISLSNSSKAKVLQLLGSVYIYTVAIYPLSETHYLQIEIHPEFQRYYLETYSADEFSQIVNSILTSVVL